MSTPEWDRVFLAVTDTFWPEFFHGELNSEDLDKAAAVADLVTKNGSGVEPGVTPVATGATSLSPKTDDGAGAPPATGGGLAGEATTTPAPSSPRSFELVRHVDVTGKSGTGVVVEGTQWTDGTVSIRWRGPNPSFANWPDVESLLAVHGHEGATELVWLDPWPEPGAATCRVCGCTDDAACFGGCYWVAEDLCSSCGDGPEGSAEVDDNEPEDTADASESLPEEG